MTAQAARRLQQIERILRALVCLLTIAPAAAPARRADPPAEAGALPGPVSLRPARARRAAGARACADVDDAGAARDD